VRPKGGGDSFVARRIRTIPDEASVAASTTLADLLTPQLAVNPISAMRASMRRWSSDELEDGCIFD
jgi:hypothetical protein